MADQVKVRLQGLPDDVEKTAVVVRTFMRVLDESSDYANRGGEFVRRYLVVKPEPPETAVGDGQQSETGQ